MRDKVSNFETGSINFFLHEVAFKPCSSTASSLTSPVSIALRMNTGLDSSVRADTDIAGTSTAVSCNHRPWPARHERGSNA